MFFGKFDVEPLLTLAAVGFIKLWLFKSTRGCINLLFVMDLLSPETGRLPKIDCWPTLLPLLLLREVIGRFLIIFGMLGITYRLTIKIILRISNKTIKTCSSRKRGIVLSFPYIGKYELLSWMQNHMHYVTARLLKNIFFRWNKGRSKQLRIFLPDKKYQSI